MNQSAHWGIRIPVFVVSLLLNSLAIVLITRAHLGTTPISSLPFVVSEHVPYTFGEATFVLNISFMVLEILLLRRHFPKLQLLQVLAVVIFSGSIDGWMVIFSMIDHPPLAAAVPLVLVGCAIMGFGICLEVASRVLMVPGEGLVAAISSVGQWKLGSVKVGFDVTLVILAAVLSNLMGGLGTFTGLGIGTVISALLVGRCVNFFNLHFPFLNELVKLSLK